MNSLGNLNRILTSNGACSIRSFGSRSSGSTSSGIVGGVFELQHRSHAIRARRRQIINALWPSSSLQNGYYFARPSERYNYNSFCWRVQWQGGLGEVDDGDDRRRQLFECRQEQNELYFGNCSWHSRRGVEHASILSYPAFHLPPHRTRSTNPPVRFISSNTSYSGKDPSINELRNAGFRRKFDVKEQIQSHKDFIGGDAKFHNKPQQQHHEPPSITKMLSILVPESRSLLLAFGALTISTVATMQIPNAIGQIIDILSISTPAIISVEDATIVASGMIDAGNGLDSLHSTSSPSPPQSSISPSEVATSINDSKTSITSQQMKQQVLQKEMESIGLQLMSYFTIGAIATFAHSTLFDTIGQKISADLRKKLFSTLIHRDLSFFDKNKAGELANRLSTDVHEVAEHLVQNFAYYLNNLVRSLTAVVQMILISPLLTATMVPLPIIIGGLASFYGKFIHRWSAQHLDVLAHSTHVASERFLGISTVVSFGQRRTEQERYNGVIEAAYKYARRVAVFQGAFMGSSYLVGNGALLAVLIVGAVQVFEGNMTAGNLVGFCLYAGHLSESVIELSTATGGILQAQGSGARLFALLEKGGEDPLFEPDTKANTSRTAAVTLPPSYNPTIRFEDVDFAYPAHPHVPVLNKLSFTLNGEMLALTGLSGSGKSSIVSLLMRFYEPTSGRITLDGVDIRDIDVDWLRSQVGLVGQEPILFHASVFDNVAYGKPHSTQDEVIEACIAAGAHRFILELPDQYDTIVGSRGASISG
jgi:ATP-binding cassette subfamily B (MDR/TAP) protein 10